MNTYQAPDGSLHAVDAAFEYLLPAGSRKITAQQADAVRSAIVSPSVETEQAENSLEQRVAALEAAVAKLGK